MNILFVIKNSANLRTLAPVVAALDSRGHRIALVCKDVKSRDSNEQLQRLVGGSAGISIVEPPFARIPGWSDLAASLRKTIDLVRYYEPRYRDADKLRARAEQEAPPAARRVVRLAGLVPGAPRALRRVLDAVERCLEPPPRLVSFLQKQAPDVLVITPLIGFGTQQADTVRAAQRLGIPVVFPVRSWDNLTNKGLMREAPDAGARLERPAGGRGRRAARGACRAGRGHRRRRLRPLVRLAAARGRVRSSAREVGLDPDRPIVLYVCSSDFIAPDEVAFVRRWVAALRAQGGALPRRASSSARTRSNARGWRELELDDRGVVWPRGGEEPLDDESRQNYFDSIYHAPPSSGSTRAPRSRRRSSAGPCTRSSPRSSARPRQGTLHFHYLVGRGVRAPARGRTLDEHARQLEESVRDGDRER